MKKKEFVFKKNFNRLTNCGKLFVQGSNGFGQLGIGKKSKNLNSFEQISSLSKEIVTVIGCGGNNCTSNLF